MIFCVLKRRIMFFLTLFLCVSFVNVQAGTGIPKEKNDKKTMFRSNAAISTFPVWLSNQLLHRHIPFSVNLAESDYLFNNIAYVDTLSQEMDLITRFTVTKGGKIKNCVVENLPDSAFADEVERLILISRKWRAPEENGRKTSAEQQFSIPLELKGSVVILDKGPEWGEADQKIYDKRYNLTRYIHQVAMHVGAKRADSVSMIEYPNQMSFLVDGILKLSFVIDKEGYFSHLRYGHDLPVAAQLDYVITRQMYPGRFFSDEVKWKPAMLDGKPVRVRVEACIDYKKKEFSWDCYLMD